MSIKEGDEYNPYNLFNGSVLPNWLASRFEISGNAKVVFERLAQYMGKNGQCYPSQVVAASACGLNLRTYQRALGELLDYSLIKSVRRGYPKTNIYKFIWHPWAEDLKSDVTNISCHSDSDMTNMSCHSDSDMTNMSCQSKSDMTNMSCQSKSDMTNMSYRRESIKSLIDICNDSFKDEFDALWPLYPKRQGTNSRVAAFKAYQARRKEGISAEILSSSTQNYAKYCQEQGKLRTEFVMQARRFFGHSKEFESFMDSKATPGVNVPNFDEAFAHMKDETPFLTTVRQHADMYSIRLASTPEAKRLYREAYDQTVEEMLKKS